MREETPVDAKEYGFIELTSCSHCAAAVGFDFFLLFLSGAVFLERPTGSAAGAATCGARFVGALFLPTSFSSSAPSSSSPPSSPPHPCQLGRKSFPYTSFGNLGLDIVADLGRTFAALFGRGGGSSKEHVSGTARTGGGSIIRKS